jgi:two-component system OmpR family response regulator
MKLLLAEDDTQIAQALVRVLGRSGHEVRWFPRGDDAEAALRSDAFDAAVLDIGLPKLDGLEILRSLRERGDPIPVMLLTARDQARDRVLGLDSGADDYLVKPFEVIEFEARVRALLRRGSVTAARSSTLRFGRLSQLAGERPVLIDGKPMSLSPREAGVLEVLLHRAGRVVSKSLVLQELSSRDPSAMDLSDAAVEVIVHRIRRKLEGSGVQIHTVRGFGYLLKPVNG